MATPAPQLADGAEPRQRFLIRDEFGKVTAVLRQPSSYPAWMPELGVPRRRQEADRLIRVITGMLAGNLIEKRDVEIARCVREWAVRNRERVYGRWGRIPPEEIDALAAVTDIEGSTGALSVSPLLIDTQPVAPRRQVCAVGRPA